MQHGKLDSLATRRDSFSSAITYIFLGWRHKPTKTMAETSGETYIIFFLFFLIKLQSRAGRSFLMNVFQEREREIAVFKSHTSRS